MAGALRGSQSAGDSEPIDELAMVNAAGPVLADKVGEEGLAAAHVRDLDELLRAAAPGATHPVDEEVLEDEEMLEIRAQTCDFALHPNGEGPRGEEVLEVRIDGRPFGESPMLPQPVDEELVGEELVGGEKGRPEVGRGVEPRGRGAAPRGEQAALHLQPVLHQHAAPGDLHRRIGAAVLLCARGLEEDAAVPRAVLK